MSEVAASVHALFEDEHEDFRESARGYFTRELAPSREAWRHDGVPREVFGSLAELGLVSMAVPEDHGGLGIRDVRFSAVVVEEAMRAGLAGLALMLSAHNDVCVPLLAHAGGESAARWLPGLASGDVIAARAAGDGLSLHRGRLSGAIDGLVGGGLADVVVAPATAGDGTVLVAIDAHAPGVERTPADELIGPFACDRADLRFDDVEVKPSAHLPATLRLVEMSERLSLAIAAVAGARAALDVTLAYVHERRAFGQPIASFENTRVALAGVAAELDTTEAFVHACMRDHAGGELSPRRAASAKLRATGLFCRAADWGLQLHGGYGYMYEYEIAHAYTAARFLRLHGGTDEALQHTIVESLGL